MRVRTPLTPLLAPPSQTAPKAPLELGRQVHPSTVTLPRAALAATPPLAAARLDAGVEKTKALACGNSEHPSNVTPAVITPRPREHRRRAVPG